MPIKTAADDPYLKLVKEFALRPLRSATDLDRAVAVIDRLTDRDELAPDEEDYLEVLSRLVEEYETELDPLPKMSPVEALRYLLDENGLTQAQLSEETGVPVATISEILNQKRAISPKVDGILAARFKVAPALFV